MKSDFQKVKTVHFGLLYPKIRNPLSGNVFYALHRQMSRNIQVEKVCQWCGSKFIARTTQTVYCSKRCAEHAYKDRKRKEKIERCKEEVRRVQSGSDEISEKDFLTPRQAA